MGKRIFVSYSWKDLNVSDRDNIISLLTKKSYFNFMDYSVDYTSPLTGSNYQVWAGIEARIKAANIVLVTAGVYTTYSESMKREIELAKKYNKPIIGVRPYGSERISSIVYEHANEIVNHNANSIVDAIRRNW